MRGETSLETGQLISHYRIIEELGAGGMGVVYKAEDLRLRRFVALKFITPAMTKDEAARQRFEREAQAASALDHPHICSIHEIDKTPDGQLFICMAHYDGELLEKLAAHRPLPASDTIDIVKQVAEGLACAHAHGIIHRDVKPANIMVTQESGVKIMDFGLAKLFPDSTGADAAPMGTCAYMSPEQASGGHVDARSDLFSLGIVLYELLTGHRPFDAEHPMSVIFQIINTAPKPMLLFRPGIDPQLQAIVDKCLQKDVATRYQSASELYDDLCRAAGDAKPRPKPTRLHVGLAAASLIAASAALVGFSPWTEALRRQLFGGAPTQQHIAVLPFENVGRDPDHQAFCDGLMETLASQLTQLEPYRKSLWVVPASVVRTEKISSPAQAGNALGVNLVVTGAVQYLADRVRVTLSLIDVAHGETPRQVNSVIIDNDLWKVSTLQDEAAMKMVDMMNMKLVPSEERVLTSGHTEVSAAYDFYLQGLGYVRSFETEGNLERAISAFSMAIDRDSSYALAFAGLGEAYWRKYKDTQDSRWIDPALANARRAIALDSLLAPAHVTLGLVESGTGQAEGAVTRFRRAIALEPTSAEAFRGLATAYADMKRPNEADATYRKAIGMKPDYWGGYHDLGIFYYQQGEYEKAAGQFLEVVRLNPGNKFAYNNLGGCYWALDQLDQARDMFLRSIEAEPNFRAYSNLGAYYSIRQSWAEAARMGEQAVKLNAIDFRAWVNLGNAYYWIPGKREQAMDAYRRAVALMEKQRELTPNNVGLLTTLEASYAVLGETKRALALIDQTMKIAPANQRVLYFAGHSCEQLGQRDRALDLIGEALDGGYPLSEVENDPWLHELRADKRFEQLHERGLRAQPEHDEK